MDLEILFKVGLVFIAIITLITIYIYFDKFLSDNQEKLDKLEKVRSIQQTHNIITSRILMLHLKLFAITNKYKAYFKECTIRVSTDYGCVLELKLLLNNNKKIHIYCNETYFKVYQNGLISKDMQDIKCLKSYIVSNCNINSKSDYLSLVEETYLFA
jgi:hypothetical protein